MHQKTLNWIGLLDVGSTTVIRTAEQRTGSSAFTDALWTRTDSPGRQLRMISACFDGKSGLLGAALQSALRRLADDVHRAPPTCPAGQETCSTTTSGTRKRST